MMQIPFGDMEWLRVYIEEREFKSYVDRRDAVVNKSAVIICNRRSGRAKLAQKEWINACSIAADRNCPHRAPPNLTHTFRNGILFDTANIEQASSECARKSTKLYNKLAYEDRAGQL